MKILHCVYTLGGGGAERQLAYLARKMIQCGVAVDVAYYKGGPNLERLERTGVNLHRLPRRSMYDPRMLSDLHSLMKLQRPDIVQTWLTQMDILAGMVADRLGIPLVLAERSSEMSYPRNVRNLLRVFIGKRASCVAANSTAGVAYWIDRGYRGKTCIIRNGIPFDDISDSRPCSILPIGSGLSLSENRKLILFAGRYDEGKNTIMMLKVVSKVLSQWPEAIAVFFGEGPSIDEMTSVHGLLPNRERIHICGYTRKLWGYMQRANVFVSLSRFEGSPNVVLEAAAAGCPLVLSDIPQHKEIISADSALFVDANNQAAAAEAIARILGNGKKALAMASRARDGVARFSLEATVAEYVQLYSSMLSERNVKCTV